MNLIVAVLAAVAMQSAPANACALTPSDVVVRYYQLWNDGQFTEMYALLSTRFRASHPYARWRKAQIDGVSFTVTTRTASRSSDVAVDLIEERSERWFHGVWHLVRSGSSWRLDAETIARGTPPPEPEVSALPSRAPIETWIDAQAVLRHGVLGNIEGSYDDRFRMRTNRSDCFVDPIGAVSAWQPDCDDVGGMGLEFAVGPAGPTRYDVLYDPADAVVWFDRGCCSASEEALIGDVSPPPDCLPNAAPLSGVHTLRGVRLGDSIADVAKIYGTSNPIAAGAYTLLLYQFHGTTGPLPLRCSQSAFAFRRGRLVAIDFNNGC